jgi:hypothetical protein
VKERVSRNQRLEEIDEELKSLKDAEKADFFDRVLAMNERPEKIGKSMGHVLVGSLLSVTSFVQKSVDRANQTNSNLIVAFALAAYKGDNGTYPAKLDDLTPKYLDRVPIDLFSGKALCYRPTEKGYVLYSVGVNGIDDNGRTMADDPIGDDIVVRMPLPELRPKK